MRATRVDASFAERSDSPSPTGALRRSALLDYPAVTLNSATLDQIVAEGFSDVSLILSGSIMAGQGFSSEQVHTLSAMAGERGLGLILVSGYMKYENEMLLREPQRGMVLVGPGDARDSDNLASMWLCPFQSTNLDHYHQVLEPLLQLKPLRELHLNDEAFLGFPDGTIGCYCPSCTQRYEALTGAPPPRTQDWESSAWWRWIEYRMQQWTAVHAELRAWAKQRRPDVVVGLQHSPIAPAWSWQAWKTAINLAADAKALDVLATDPYPFNHASVVDHRPHRRILTEVTRSLAGACLDKPMHIFPQGFMPPGQATPMGRADGLLAGVVPFALGAQTVTPFNYPLMRIIPGFLKAFQETQRLDTLFSTHTPYTFATVLCPLQSEMHGHPTEDWGRQYLSPLADAMVNVGLPWGWFWDGRLEDRAQRLTGPLVLPETHALTATQRASLEAVAQRGEGLLWLGATPTDDWPGQGPCPLPAPHQRGQFAVRLTEDRHPLLEGLHDPLILATRTEALPTGDWHVLGWIDEVPALAIREEDGRREAWLAGRVEHRHVPAGMLAVAPTAGLELMRRLLRWVSATEPILWMDPSPPVDDYRRLRPGDYRNVPVAELLPMVGRDSVLGLLVPYTPVGFETRVWLRGDHVRRVRRITDHWQGQDLTDRLVVEADGRGYLPITAPGDLDLMAIHFELIDD